MKINYREKQLFSLLRQDSLREVATLATEIFSKACGDSAEEHKLSYWQLVFLQSKANGCSYRGEGLPQMKWQWPRDTWFQEELAHRLKARKFAAHQTRNGQQVARVRIVKQLSGGVRLDG